VYCKSVTRKAFNPFQGVFRVVLSTPREFAVQHLQKNYIRTGYTFPGIDALIYFRQIIIQDKCAQCGTHRVYARAVIYARGQIQVFPIWYAYTHITLHWKGTPPVAGTVY
jgi:hypothetical protein